MTPQERNRCERIALIWVAVILFVIGLLFAFWGGEPKGAFTRIEELRIKQNQAMDSISDLLETDSQTIKTLEGLKEEFRIIEDKIKPILKHKRFRRLILH